MYREGQVKAVVINNNNSRMKQKSAAGDNPPIISRGGFGPNAQAVEVRGKVVQVDRERERRRERRGR